jgi:hypothetical protein
LKNELLEKIKEKNIELEEKLFSDIEENEKIDVTLDFPSKEL